MRTKISDQYILPDDSYSFAVVWNLSGYLDQDVTAFSTFAEAFNIACEEFELALSAAKDLLKGNSVYLHRGNSNVDVSAKHTLQYIFIDIMSDSELESLSER